MGSPHCEWLRIWSDPWMHADRDISLPIRSHSGGGVAVCASGPESLTVETRNAVARMGVGNALKLGGVVVHVESFAL
ncbi:hypothetical protein EDC04DRAFT_2662686 [Pisolithus marmoratus]|nr:hypothetical protein EDC04DRAFT_2662686 [Pisolithus marmoratus]